MIGALLIAGIVGYVLIIALVWSLCCMASRCDS